MRSTVSGVLAGVVLLAAGVLRTADAANATGSCIVRATFRYVQPPGAPPPPPRWELVGVACVGTCPPNGGVAGTCQEYQTGGGMHPEYSCACKYERTNQQGEPQVVWNFSNQVCDGRYTRNVLDGGSLDPLSHYCTGPCPVGGQACQKDALPTEGVVVGSEATRICECK
jgi:hypothetical protein